MPPTDHRVSGFTYCLAASRRRALRGKGRVTSFSWRKEAMSRSFLTTLGMLAMIAGVVLTMQLWAQNQEAPIPTKEANAKAPDYQFSGPYTHDNLTIFLIQGEDQLKGKKF